MTHLQENGATTVKVEEKNSLVDETQERGKNMTNLQENVATTVQVEENFNNTETEYKNETPVKVIEMLEENVAMEAISKKHERSFFGQKSISQDVAVQKTILLANEFLKEAKNFDEDYCLAISYKNINPLIYSDIFCSQVVNHVCDEFVEEYDFDDLLDFDSFYNYNFPKIRYGISLNLSKENYTKFAKKVQKVGKMQIDGFWTTRNEKINFADILHWHSALKNNIGKLKLVEVSFIFDIKKTTLEEGNKSKIIAIISLAENTSKNNPQLKRYYLEFSLAMFLKHSLEPFCWSEELSINEIVKKVYEY